MFNTTEIAKRIKQARINKNMTQLKLADEMGVSFQAVSNWERGNSMPDISKLEDLCRVLELSVSELLGMGADIAQSVNKAMREEEPLTPEELADVAPMLPPAEVKVKTEESRKKKKLNLEAIVDLAPFLDEEYLDELVLEAAGDGNLDGIEDLAPFVSKATLEKLVESAQADDLEQIVELAPFLSKKALDRLVCRCVDASDYELLEELAPFASKETLEKLVDQCLEKGDAENLEELYPFLSKETLRKIARHLMEDRNMDALEDIMPFI